MQISYIRYSTERIELMLYLALRGYVFGIYIYKVIPAYKVYTIPRHAMQEVRCCKLGIGLLRCLHTLHTRVYS
jgi:hypothetical protein